MTLAVYYTTHSSVFNHAFSKLAPRGPHGGLKPENIGINLNPPRAILLDFGCAHRIYEGLATTPGVGGTIAYLSPERNMSPWGLS